MITVYYAGTEGMEAVYEYRIKELHQSRAEKLTQYKMTDDRIRGLTAGLLLEHGLCEYIKENNLRPIEREQDGRLKIEYGYKENGKPFLKAYPEIHFSLSHSGDLVVLAIGDKEIGIDVQQWKGYQDKIAKRFYHANEKERLEHCEPKSREELFYRFWCIKEAYIKYTGRGIGQELDGFYTDEAFEKVYDAQGTFLAECMCLDFERKKYQAAMVCEHLKERTVSIRKVIL